MKIGIDIRSTLKKTNTGIGRYTLNLIKALSEIDQKNNYHLYARKKLFDFKRRLPGLPGKNFRHVRDFLELDVFHTSSYDLERPKSARKFIVTIHDVIIKAYPHGHSKETIKEIDRQLKKVLGEADLLIADSHNTKSDIIKFYNVSDSKIHVIYPGVVLDSPLRGSLEQYSSSEAEGRRPKEVQNEAQPFPKKGRDEVEGYSSSEAAEGSRVEKYILFVGTLEPRKNIQGLIKAFNWLKKQDVGGGRDRPLRLYIAGMKGWMYEDIFKEYENSEFKDDIIFKGYVDDKKLAELYQNASVFVYPSFYEGFGFPIVEAFSYGVPVVTSKTSSCGEITGDSALLINPEDYREIGEAILKIINNENLRQELINKGFERAKEFTWQNTAKGFLEIAEKVQK